MLGRRHWLKTTVGFVSATLLARFSFGQEGFGNFNAATKLDDLHISRLEDQLRLGLRAVFPNQQQFVTQVVQAVSDGRLPRAMVNLVYRWALERNPRVPFPYFQFALLELARRRKITI